MRAHANGDPNMQEVGFFFEAAQNFVYQIYSRVKNQKKKHKDHGLHVLAFFFSAESYYKNAGET
jgi:hypothetical protein